MGRKVLGPYFSKRVEKYKHTWSEFFHRRATTSRLHTSAQRTNERELRPEDMQRLSISAPVSQYDPGSGQVFKEKTIAVRPYLRARRQWASKLVLERPSRADIPGAPSLEDIAIRECLTNLRNFTPETLQYVPVHLAQRIFKQAEDLGLDTREVWQAFAATYKEAWPSYHASADINLLCSFPEYVASLNSPTFHWMTALTLSGTNLSRTDIIRISGLQNLIGLDISGHNSLTRRAVPGLDDKEFEVVDDSIVRNWTRHVTEFGAFPKLLVLILRNQAGITPRVFEYLNDFPALNLFGVRGCRVSELDGEKSAKAVGWTSEDNNEHFLDTLKRDIGRAHTWDAPMRSCIDRSAALSTHEASPYSPGTPSGSTPILNFRLGATSSDVIFNAPTVFYRNQKPRLGRKHRAPTFSDGSESLGPIPVTAAGDKIEQSDVQSDSEHRTSFAKRRKIRPQKQKSSGVLDEFMQEFAAADLTKD